MKSAAQLLENGSEIFKLDSRASAGPADGHVDFTSAPYQKRANVCKWG